MTLLFLPDQAVGNLTTFSLGQNTDAIALFSYGLYTTNYTPVASDILSTYVAIECVLSGYGRATMAPSAFTGGVVSHQSQYVAPALTWNFSAYGGGTTIYGLFAMYHDVSPADYLIGASLLATPYPVPSGGGSFAITPTWLEYSA
jgi:hypothetical protein